MLYILLLFCICIIIAGIICNRKTSHYSETGDTLTILGSILITVALVATVVTGAKYNSIKSTASSQIEVLNQQNEIVLTQITPLVEQALNYESNTYKEFKLSLEKVIAFGNMYPQLQANSFIQSQIDIIVENQNEIKNLKLKIVSLNAYRLWLFTKKE